MADTYLTLADLAKRQKFGGGIDDVIEVLTESNPIIKDAAVIEGNLPTGHRSTQRATLPVGTWRKLNSGVDAEKSTTIQVDDTCGMLEGFSKIDVALAGLGGNAASFRASEDDAFITGLNQTAAAAIFNANTQLDPEKMHGFTPRYNSSTGGTGPNVIKAGGSGADNTSIWLVTWGPQTAHLIYPKGTKGGLTSEDLGKQLVQDSNQKSYMAYVTHYVWNLGLAIRDWRYCVRVCNIDLSDLNDDASGSSANLVRRCIAAYYKRPTVDLGKMAKTFWYCNKTVAEYLHVQAMNKTNVNLSLGTDSAGQPITNILGAPVHICDAIGIAETLVA